MQVKFWQTYLTSLLFTTIQIVNYPNCEHGLGSNPTTCWILFQVLNVVIFTFTLEQIAFYPEQFSKHLFCLDSC